MKGQAPVGTCAAVVAVGSGTCVRARLGDSSRVTVEGPPVPLLPDGCR